MSDLCPSRLTLYTRGSCPKVMDYGFLTLGPKGLLDYQVPGGVGWHPQTGVHSPAWAEHQLMSVLESPKKNMTSTCFIRAVDLP